MTTSVTWRQGLELPHDPDDITDIEMDMSAIVGDSDTLSSTAITNVGVTGAELSSTAQGVVTFRVSGGTVDQASSVTVQITMTSGRKQSRTTKFNVLER